MVIVVGSVQARSETLQELLMISLEHVRRSREEDGCVEHVAQIDCEDPLRIRFLERWRDLSALGVHFARSESRAFSRRVAELSASPPAMSIYQAEEKSIADLMGNTVRTGGASVPGVMR